MSGLLQTDFLKFQAEIFSSTPKKLPVFADNKHTSSLRFWNLRKKGAECAGLQREEKAVAKGDAMLSWDGQTSGILPEGKRIITKWSETGKWDLGNT